MPISWPGRVACLFAPGVRVFALVLLSSGICHATEAPFPARIGNSVVVLTGPWKFHGGDDLNWAQPDFDDSNWAALDLTPPEGSYDPVTGSGGFVSGWTSHGYPNMTGYAWYRMRVRLEDEDAGSAGSSLAIAMPLNFDDAYQVFADGREIGEFGRFTPGHVLFYNSQPRSFPLPADVHNGTVTIAIRFWMDTSTWLTAPDVGGLHGPPLLGESSAVDAMLRLEWDAVNRTQVGNLLSSTFLFLVALLGFTLIWFDRHEPAYLLLGIACTADFLARATVMTGYYSMLLSMVFEAVVLDVVLHPLSLGMWALFWAYWFQLENMRRIARIAGILVVLLMLATAMLRPPLYGSWIPAGASSWLLPLTLALKLLLAALLLWVTYQGMRKRPADGWLAVAPIVLTIFWAYQEELSVIHVPTIARIFGLTISVGHIAILLMLAIVSVLLMLRFIRGQRERELWRLEIEQARQVQQVLIPEALPKVPGFQLASDYRPAQQVGGDFFQIMQLKGGGVLAVIGDVSGKGMPAAMTVSLLVGTVRTLVHFTDNPGEILSAMNVRMLARSHGGFTTCLVMRVAPDGLVTVANAGHLSPYCGARELELKNGLPLGLAANSTYPETQFQLGIAEQMTLMTDGVIEARGRNRELYGFERAAAIANHSAESIGRAAQEFGQEDDITVLTLTRVTARQEPISQFTSPALAPSVA